MRRNRPITDTHQPRGGFSLVELLVVMAIIAILASLAFVVLGASGNAAREAATKSMIRALSGAVRERANAFQEATAGFKYVDYDVPMKVKNHAFRARVNEFQQYYEAGGNYLPALYRSGEQGQFDRSRPAERSEIYVRKTMFKSAFPQRLEDMYGYDGAAGGGDDSPLLTRMYDSGGSPIVGSWIEQNIATPEADSSELLYLALNSGDVYGLPPADLGGVDQNLIGDTDGDGNLEFLDGWKRPLQFYNWPTRLLKDDGSTFTGSVTVGSNTYPTASLLISNLPLTSSTAAASATTNRNRIDRDPEDITRVMTVAPAPLMSPFDLRRGSAPAFAAMPFTPAWYHDANTASSPLIVSAGADGVLGLYLPNANTYDGSVTGTSNDGIDRLARVIHTDEACLGLSDNVTNQQRGPQ